MSSLRTCGAAIILLFAGFVNANASDVSKRLARLAKQVIAGGHSDEINRVRSKFLDIEAGTPTKVQDVSSDEAEDDRGRVCEVCLWPNSKKVSHVILLADKQIDADHSEGMYFKVSPEGELEKAIATTVSYKDGKVVRGAGKAEPVDLDAPGVREKFQRELDFWLRGKFRKKADKAAAAPAQ